jgi:uncharacterized protein YdhG (YjbR/CyaY superfamily)
MSAQKSTSASRARATDEEAQQFTSEERSAMKERAKELRSSAKRAKADQVDPEVEVLDKIAEMEPADRAMAERIHAIVQAAAPELAPRLWYGMPAYARNGKVLCFFQPATKFRTRYATLGFSDEAHLDDGALWPNAYAVTADLSDADATRIGELVKQAMG